MNVFKRDKLANIKLPHKNRNELVRKDSSLGIRGAPTFHLLRTSKSNNTIRNFPNAPRYQFSDVEFTSKSKSNCMGPPLEPPKSLKRKLTCPSASSAKPDSSSSGRRPRVLASDSGAVDTSDFCTPRNRGSVLRYISSSSRGGKRAGESPHVKQPLPPMNICNTGGFIDALPTFLREGEWGEVWASGTLSNQTQHNSRICIISAISEGRGMARGEIGIAAVDLRHPHLVLCQFSDTLLYTHTLTKINYFNPVEVTQKRTKEIFVCSLHFEESCFNRTYNFTRLRDDAIPFYLLLIIVPHTFCEGVQPSQVYQLIKDHFPTLNITTVQRRHFNDAVGRQQIQSLCAPQYSAVYLQVLHKFYALTAAAAVLKYVEYIQCIVFARESLKIEYHSSEHTMIIDVGTATQLELVQPLVPSAGTSCCLLGVLGPTYTVGGIRALRAAILQPSCNRELIEARLDAVQDLIENEDGLMVGLQDVIKKLSDIDKILLLCMDSSNQNFDKIGEAQLNQTLLLKTTMELVPSLVEALNVATSVRLRTMKLDFENQQYKEISERIRNIIQDDAHLEKGAMGSLQRCFAVKPDINGLLDVARRTYSELIEDIQKIVEQLSETYDLPVRLNQNVLKGFHIVMPIAPRNRRNFKVEELPDVFIQVHNNGASVSMTTEELVVLDQQAKESLNEIQKMSNIVISSLLKDLRPFMSSLYKLCENVAELDILLALAQISSVGAYVRPEFSSYLDVRNSVHPLLDYNSQTMPIPNDIYASPEHNFSIITGPNMGGKSIYIKQIATIQIMAQLGCFVPATNAVLRLSDRVFSRIGFNDSVELNASTYVLEMKEIQHILQGLTKTSLVIIDELCRGTCTEEGTSVAWAICEQLLLSDAFTFFTTHFMYLTRLQDLYFNVVNLQTMVTEEDSTNSQSSQATGTQIPQKRLVYQHKIEAGITKVERYGLALASNTYLPEETVKLAEELAELIIQRKKPQEIHAPEKRDVKILYELNAEVRKITRKNGQEEAIKQIIEKFKKDNPDLIEKLKLESSINSSAKIRYKNYSEIRGSNKLTSNVNITKQNKPTAIVYSTSDMENDTNNFSNTDLNTMNNHHHKPPIVVYSTDEMETNSKYDKENVTLVRSSNELLNSIFFNGNNNEANCDLDYSDKDTDVINNSNTFSNKALCSKEIHKTRKNNDKSPEMNSLNYLEQAEMHNDASNQDITITKDVISINKSYEELDIAEALTQVLDTESDDDIYVEGSDVDSLISIDEELLSETVQEINEELVNASLLESLILTPPMEFRD